MINVTYYCTPRQVGKTNLAMYEAIKNDNSLILTHSEDYAKYMIKYDQRLMHNRPSRIKATSCNRFVDMPGSFPNVEVLILDEYQMWRHEERERLYHIIYGGALSKLKEVIVFTTPSTQIPFEMFDYVASCKTSGMPLALCLDLKNIKKANPKWFLLPIDSLSLVMMIRALWYDLSFLDCNDKDAETFVVKFFDGNIRLPFFNYKSDLDDEARRAIGHSEAEITGQFIVN